MCLSAALDKSGGNQQVQPRNLLVAMVMGTKLGMFSIPNLVHFILITPKPQFTRKAKKGKSLLDLWSSSPPSPSAPVPSSSPSSVNHDSGHVYLITVTFP